MHVVLMQTQHVWRRDNNTTQKHKGIAHLLVRFGRLHDYISIGVVGLRGCQKSPGSALPACIILLWLSLASGLR